MGLLYDAAVLPGLWAEVGYWGLRVKGFTDNDIRGSIVLGCGAAALMAWPSAREGAALAVFLPLRFRRGFSRIHDGRIGQMTRAGVLLTILLYQGWALMRNGPVLLGPFSRLIQAQSPPDPTRELSNHDTRLGAMEAWKSQIEARNYPERMAIAEQAIGRIEKRLDTVLQICIAAVLPGFAWAFQQLFKIIMGRKATE